MANSNDLLTAVRNQPIFSNPNTRILPPTQAEIAAIEPFGHIPFHRLGRISGFGQVQNLSDAALTISKVQAAFRTAERGDTRLLFSYYRDLFLASGPVYSEMQKRKLAVISQPYKILPFDKENEDDKVAAKVIEDMIQTSPNWRDDLIHLMNSIIFPLAVSEKIFEPYNQAKDGKKKYSIRYKFKGLMPVDWQLICYRLPYLPGGPLNPTSLPIFPSPPLLQTTTNRPEATIFDPDAFEPWLRFWPVLPNGMPFFDFAQIYEPDPMRHFIYRSNLSYGMAPDNFGGMGRAVIFLALMASFGREYWLRYQDQFGTPFIVAKVDTSQLDTVEFLTQQLAISQQQHALMVNKDADIQICEAGTQAASKGHETFVQWCRDEISLLISGQTLSSTAKSTGLGSGVANLQGQVREDIIQYDRQSLGNALRTQLFEEYLRINGFSGRPPLIVWGGSSPQDAKVLADTLAQLATAGLKVSPTSIETISERLGFEVEAVELTSLPKSNNNNLNNNDKQNDNDQEPEDKSADNE